MKKVLVLTFHFPPFNAIASYRAEAFAMHLSKFGYYPTIVTHNWSNKTSSAVETEEYDSYKVIRLPFMQGKLSKLYNILTKLRLPLSIFSVLAWCLGEFDLTKEQLDSTRSYRKFLFDHLRKEKYDLALSISTPYNHVKLLRQLYQKYKLPYVSDFRDLIDNRLTHPDFEPRLVEQIRIKLLTKSLKRWLNDAVFVTTVSSSWARFLEDQFGKKAFEVKNGYEPEHLKLSEQPSYDLFEISSIGTLYDAQKWEVYFQAIQGFLKDKDPAKVKVNFIGIREGYRINAWKEIEENIPSRFLNLKGRVPKSDAIKVMQDTSVLLFPISQSVVGYYTGKLFEYIAMRTPILAYPSDDDVACNLIRSTGTGYCLENQQELSEALDRLYQTWLTGGKVSISPDHDKIEDLKRENQVKRLAELFDQYITHP